METTTDIRPFWSEGNPRIAAYCQDLEYFTRELRVRDANGFARTPNRWHLGHLAKNLKTIAAIGHPK